MVVNIITAIIFFY